MTPQTEADHMRTILRELRSRTAKEYQVEGTLRQMGERELAERAHCMARGLEDAAIFVESTWRNHR